MTNTKHLKTTFVDSTGATIFVIVNHNPMNGNYIAFVSQDNGNSWSMMGESGSTNCALDDAQVQWNYNLDYQAV